MFGKLGTLVSSRTLSTCPIRNGMEMLTARKVDSICLPAGRDCLAASLEGNLCDVDPVPNLIVSVEDGCLRPFHSGSCRDSSCIIDHIREFLHGHRLHGDDNGKINVQPQDTKSRTG